MRNGSEPRRHEVHVGFACSYHCVFCPSAAPGVQRAWAKTEEIVAELDQVRGEGIESLNFSGGEPTLHPEFLEIVGHARRAGFAEIGLITNGYGFAEEERCRQFLEAGIGRVSLSLHSHDEKIEDRLTHSDGAFHRKVKAIGNLVRSGTKPAIKTVLHGQIQSALADLAAFVKGLGVSDLGFNCLRPGHLARDKSWVPAFSELTPRLRELVARNEAELGMNISFLDVPVCRLPWEVLSNPTLRRRYLGENLERGITIFLPERAGGKRRVDWHQERTSDMKTHPQVCKSCMLKDSCEGVWRGYLEIYGEREFESGPGLVESSLAEAGE